MFSTILADWSPDIAEIVTSLNFVGEHFCNVVVFRLHATQLKSIFLMLSATLKLFPEVSKFELDWV